MNRRSPTLEGFRAAFRHPALGTAEIAWRWSFGAAACLVLAFSFLEYVDTLPVSSADLLLLRTRHPFLLSRAISDILRGSAFHFVTAAIVLFTALSIGWILAVSLGRAATVQWLLDYFRQRAQDLNSATGAEFQSSVISNMPSSPPSATSGGHVSSMAGLNTLRVALTLAATFGCLGAIILSGFASSPRHPRPGLVFLLFVPLFGLVWLTWSVLNWFLSLASIFVIRDQEDTFGSVSAVVNLCRERLGPITAVSFWFGLAHLSAFFVATTVVAFPLGFADVVPAKAVLISVLLITLLYFAVADWLYAGRLAAYVAIIEGPAVQPATLEPPPAMTPRPATRVWWPGIPASDDDIVSDLPLQPVPEHS
jgi:hypothetical protein